MCDDQLGECGPSLRNRAGAVYTQRTKVCSTIRTDQQSTNNTNGTNKKLLCCFTLCSMEVWSYLQDRGRETTKTKSSP